MCLEKNKIDEFGLDMTIFFVYLAKLQFKEDINLKQRSLHEKLKK